MKMIDTSDYTSPMIEVRSLAKDFGSLRAVRNVSFEVAKGEVFGLLGPNGAGKTTTINMMSTLLTPTAGTATVNGYDVVTQRNQVRRSIGLVFQASTLDESLTAEQNLVFHGYAYGMSAGDRKTQIEELLTMVELWGRRRDTVRDFSGGMRRRLEIARGLLHRPKVLFLDEPTLGLDPQTRRRIWDYLNELRERHNLTIVLTTHYMDEAENCDRIAVIDHGRIVALDIPDRLKAEVGGDLITITTSAPDEAAREVRDRYGFDTTIQEDVVRFQTPAGETFLPDFVRGFGQPLEAIGLRRPTLDDVFLHLTGREIRDDDGEPAPALTGRGGWR